MPTIAAIATAQSSAAARDWNALASIAHKLARRWTRHVEEARDVAQESLLRLFTSAHVRDPIPWLFVTTRRLALRQQQRARRWSPYDANRVSARATTPPSAIGRGLLFRHIRTDRTLSPRYRRVLLLIATGHTHVEIAQRIGSSRRDVGQLAARALRRLQKRPDVLSARRRFVTPS
jgi:RNA polymerase sigma factor (sigma-70 family)